MNIRFQERSQNFKVQKAYFCTFFFFFLQRGNLVSACNPLVESPSQKIVISFLETQSTCDRSRTKCL